MKTIRKDEIEILERRRDFLARRVEHNKGKHVHGDYDASELRALNTAISLMRKKASEENRFTELEKYYLKGGIDADR